MTAPATDTAYTTATWKHRNFTLKSGEKVYQGDAIGYDRATNKVVQMPDDGSGATLVFLGFADRAVDATSSGPKGAVDQDVGVDLIDEVALTWVPNAADGDAVASTDVFKDCYWFDNQTVTSTSTGNPLAGRVWAVDSTKGVLVEKKLPVLSAPPDPALAEELDLPAYSSHDSAPTDIVNGAIYSVPADDGAAQTVTLPAAASDGTVAYFTSDGTTTHTVQYRDETGPTNLTTALTASKRHMVVASKTNGKWFATAYVSP